MTTSTLSNSVFRGFIREQKLTGPNFIDWYRQLRIVLSIEDKLNYLEHPLPPAPVAPAGQQVAPKILAAHTAWELKTLFAQQAEQKLLQTTRDFHSSQHSMIKLYSPTNNAPALHAIRAGKVQKGHWKRNCPQYLAELLKKKKNATSRAGGSDAGSKGPTKDTTAHNRMCVYIKAEEHELGDLVEPANYKACIVRYPESDKWLNAMNVEMQSMKDNEVWVLVELPPNGKTVGSKWLFKKKTNMDGAVHTYKARLMAKGYTQTLGIDYGKPSSFAVISAIRFVL
ncbi:zinc finger, CCHC-type containing protein [Tanacetum coccineum]